MPEAQQQEKPLNELLSRDMVDIYVGPNNTHWILHEKLLCYHSPYFRKIFYSKTSPTKRFGLPDDEDSAFKLFVGWLYSSSLPVPREENDLTNLFDLYLLAEKLQIQRLAQDVLQSVREWYKFSDTYPGLRRVQYVYANTEEGSPMRTFLVHAVARMMCLADEIPKHWDKALRKNGQLAVDLIKAIQEWRLGEDEVPDAREDPAEAEELVDVEEEVEGEGEEVQVDGEVDGEVNGEVDEEADVGAEADGEETVVETPNGVDGKPRADSVHDIVPDELQEKKKSAKKDLPLRELPNGLESADYGTVH